MTDEQKKKRKSAIAQERARARKGQHVNELEDMVRELWKRVQYLEMVIKTLHPSEALDDLYRDYEPYAVSQTIRPLGSDAAASNHLMPRNDMSELAWLLMRTPRNSNEEEKMKGV